MYGMNKETRSFLVINATTIQNGFVNNGLIEHCINCDYDGYQTLERLYFEALKRNMCNRIITLRVKKLISDNEF
jgi:hypothetical protein